MGSSQVQSGKFQIGEKFLFNSGLDAMKMNFRILMKNHAADPEKGSFTKSI